MSNLKLPHSLTNNELFTEFKTSEKGLSENQIYTLQQTHGLNSLSTPKRHILFEYLRQLKNPLVLILITASLLSYLFGEHIDAFIILTIVMLSITLDFIQEYSAAQAAAHLKAKLATTTTAIRNGKTETINVDQLVPGDIIQVQAGNLIPADGRVIEAEDFFVNQSSLTGESFPVEKTAQMLENKELDLTEQHNMVFMGTNVETGHATILITTTGIHTQFGALAKDLNENTPSDFTKGVNAFSNFMLKLTIGIVVIVFFLNTFLKGNVVESFLFALAIAVGLTPELLPMIMSINMAKGAMDMARKGVIVKHLPSIPNFGSMDVLCTDKTGTLTQDKITLIKYEDPFGEQNMHVLREAYLASYYKTGLRNALDTAVVDYQTHDLTTVKKIDEIPYDFVRKQMSVVVEEQGSERLITKGAPEEVLKNVDHFAHHDLIKPIDPVSHQKMIAHYHQLSAQGYRVLAIASKSIEQKKHKYQHDDETSLTFLGFISFYDPPKEDVKKVLTELTKMGITVKVITGDNELVTQKVCTEVGLPVTGTMLGTQLHEMTDDALRRIAEKTTIFARVSPDQKNRIISALQHHNHVVGYMGDGINDAPSLKHADVGISVSNAVDIAKESASIILTHKSLRVLRDGILEGRTTFANTLKYIKMGISSNFGNMFSVIGAVIFLPFLPMLPIQILLNNLLYDIAQITLPTDRVDHEQLFKPQKWHLPDIQKFMLIFGPISSAFDFITFFVLYNVFHLTGAAFQTGWFMESLATQTLVIYIIRTRKLPFIQSSPSKALLISTLTVVAVGWLLPLASIAPYFNFTALPPWAYLSLFAITVAYLLCVTLLQHFTTHARRLHSDHNFDTIKS